MASNRGLIADFERAFDQFFDEMLIAPWKRGPLAADFERAQVIEHSDRYEVRLEAIGVDPAEIEAEVSGQRLAVRVRGKLGAILDGSFEFAEPINGEASSAKWSEGTLVVILPKQKSRRIALKAS
jgi:HSP20 family molecular chaperone IbpA